MPGVVILDEVISSLKKHILGFEFFSLSVVKFLSPLLPDIMVQLKVTKKSDDLLGFTCTAEGRLICSGQVHFRV